MHRKQDLPVLLLCVVNTAECSCGDAERKEGMLTTERTLLVKTTHTAALTKKVSLCRNRVCDVVRPGKTSWTVFPYVWSV